MSAAYNAAYVTVIDLKANLSTINGNTSFTVGDVTYTHSSNTIKMNKNGTIYYYGSASTNNIIAPTQMSYTAGQAITLTNGSRLSHFMFVPD